MTMRVSVWMHLSCDAAKHADKPVTMSIHEKSEALCAQAFTASGWKIVGVTGHPSGDVDKQYTGEIVLCRECMLEGKNVRIEIEKLRPANVLSGESVDGP